MSLLDIAGTVNEFCFEDDEIEGKVHEIETENEEDMVVYACYIAECLAFNRKIDISTKGVKFLRNKIIDTILSLTYI